MVLVAFLSPLSRFWVLGATKRPSGDLGLPRGLWCLFLGDGKASVLECALPRRLPSTARAFQRVFSAFGCRGGRRTRKKTFKTSPFTKNHPKQNYHNFETGTLIQKIICRFFVIKSPPPMATGRAIFSVGFSGGISWLELQVRPPRYTFNI